MTVRILTHASCVAHDPGPGHPESPRRLQAIVAELEGPGYRETVEWVEAPAVSPDDLARVHPVSHVERLRACAAAGGGRLDEDTVMNAHSLEAALRAAGGAVEAARAALQGTPALAAVRPPGHHATADRAMGFCLLNSVVVAARHALAVGGVDRVLIIDWDVHHGNGTQALVETDPRIRYVSLHQWPLYPGTGREDERGVGNIFNLPRPPGLAPRQYSTDLHRGVERAVEGWLPDLILISAGYDAMAGDPLGGFTLEPADYAALIRRWRGLGAPIGAVLEGGYAPDRIKLAVGQTVLALAG